MTFCNFKLAEERTDVVVLICKACQQSIVIPKGIDWHSIKRQCVVGAPEGHERYAIWHGEKKGWEFKWLRVGLDLEPDKFEICPPDRSRIGTKLESIIAIAGYESDNETCDCKMLKVQFDNASIPFLTKYIDRAVKLVLYSASKKGHFPHRLAVKGALFIAIKSEKIRLTLPLNRS